MYKFSDIKSEIIRRLKMFFQNHLFFCYFLFFVCFMGTIGIWITPVLLNSPFSGKQLLNSFNTLNLIAFTAPLLFTFIFDKITIASRKLYKSNSQEDVIIYVWFGTLSLLLLISAALLFAMGSRNSDEFSWLSLIAVIIILMIWIVGSVDNPSYQKDSSPSTPTGGKKADANSLKRGD